MCVHALASKKQYKPICNMFSSRCAKVCSMGTRLMLIPMALSLMPWCSGFLAPPWSSKLQHVSTKLAFKTDVCEDHRRRSSSLSMMMAKKKKGPAADALAQLEALEAELEPVSVDVEESPPPSPKKKNKKKKKGPKGAAADALAQLEELEAEGESLPPYLRPLLDALIYLHTYRTSIPWVTMLMGRVLFNLVVYRV